MSQALQSTGHEENEINTSPINVPDTAVDAAALSPLQSPIQQARRVSRKQTSKRRQTKPTAASTTTAITASDPVQLLPLALPPVFTTLSLDEQRSCIEEIHSHRQWQAPRSSNAWATSDDIDLILRTCQKSWGFQYLASESLAAASPIDSDQSIAKTGCWNVIDMITNVMTAERQLVRPLVFFINTASISASELLSVEHGVHWVVCLIIPDATPLRSVMPNLPKYLIYYMDPLGTKMPRLLRQRLTCEDSITDLNGTAQPRTPPFPGASVREMTRRQQYGGSDCGYWGLFNLFYVLSKNQLPTIQPDGAPRTTAKRIRSVMQNPEEAVLQVQQVLEQVHSDTASLFQQQLGQPPPRQQLDAVYNKLSKESLKRMAAESAAGYGAQPAVCIVEALKMLLLHRDLTEQQRTMVANLTADTSGVVWNSIVEEGIEDVDQQSSDAHLRVIQLKYKRDDKPSLSPSDPDLGKTLFNALSVAMHNEDLLSAGKLHFEFWSKNIEESSDLAYQWVKASRQAGPLADSLVSSVGEALKQVVQHQLDVYDKPEDRLMRLSKKDLTELCGRHGFRPASSNTKAVIVAALLEKRQGTACSCVEECKLAKALRPMEQSEKASIRVRCNAFIDSDKFSTLLASFRLVQCPKRSVLVQQAERLAEMYVKLVCAPYIPTGLSVADRDLWTTTYSSAIPAKLLEFFQERLISSTERDVLGGNLNRLDARRVTLSRLHLLLDTHMDALRAYVTVANLRGQLEQQLTIYNNYKRSCKTDDNWRHVYFVEQTEYAAQQMLDIVQRCDDNPDAVDGIPLANAAKLLTGWWSQGLASSGMLKTPEQRRLENEQKARRTQNKQQASPPPATATMNTYLTQPVTIDLTESSQPDTVDIDSPDLTAAANIASSVNALSGDMTPMLESPEPEVPTQADTGPDMVMAVPVKVEMPVTEALLFDVWTAGVAQVLRDQPDGHNVAALQHLQQNTFPAVNLLAGWMREQFAEVMVKKRRITR